MMYAGSKKQLVDVGGFTKVCLFRCNLNLYLLIACTTSTTRSDLKYACCIHV